MDPNATDGYVFSLHKLATIGLVLSFGEEREFFFYRRDMTPESLRNMVENFVDQMKISRKAMVNRLPKSILEGWKQYSDLIHSAEFKKFTPEAKNLARKKLGLLKDILALPIYSWISVPKLFWYYFYIFKVLNIFTL